MKKCTKFYDYFQFYITCKNHNYSKYGPIMIKFWV